jgi:protein-disulfide isomerase
MYRRFLVSFLKHSLLFVFLVCLGCSAQSSAPSDLNTRIERQVRAYFQIPPNVQIVLGERKASSEFPGYEQLPITFVQGDHKQGYDFLISKDGKTLVRMTKIDVTKDPYAETMSRISLKDRPFMGPKDAKVVLVNYDDFECPFCRQMHGMLMQDIMKKYGDRVKLVYKDYPLYQIHPWANRAAVDANCLAGLSNEAYWGFANYVHAHAPEISGEKGTPIPDQLKSVDKVALDQGQVFKLDGPKLQACINKQDDSAVKASVSEAESLSVEATPTLFINGQRVDGIVPLPQIYTMIDQALKDAGQTSPAQAAGAPSGSK